MSLAFLITSKARRKLLSLFLSEPNSKFYIREICRKINEETNVVRTELKKFEKAGLVTSKEEGNLKYYTINKEFFLYSELRSIFTKTEGVSQELKKELEKVEGIKYSFIYGSFVTGEVKSSSDIDLMIIGDMNLDDLTKKIQKVQTKLKRTINPTIYSTKEFKEKKKEPFLKRVLKEDKIMIVGDETELG